MASLGSDSRIFVNSVGVHVGAHPICCVVRLFKQLVLQKFISEFFHQGTCISDVHTGAYPISVLWNEMDDFFSRMSDCDVFSSLTLIACAVMRF